MSAERERLESNGAAWRRWGPYLSERAWGTVREDYSPNGQAWQYFPHDHARSRAYRWNEDGLAGLSDDRQNLCFALALWNGHDPILKERLFGLTGLEGNHGEDVKEYYYYLDSTPTHSFMRMLYKYPHGAFPYADLAETNGRRGRLEREYELVDTGILADDRYFDIFVEYAKAAPDDILIRITGVNRGPDAAELHILPMLWFRNTWSWGIREEQDRPRPIIRRGEEASHSIITERDGWGRYVLVCEEGGRQDVALTGAHVDGRYDVALTERASARMGVHLNAPTRTRAAGPVFLFTENETNQARLYNAPNASPFVKDGIGEAIVNGRMDSVNPAGLGTKAAAHYRFSLGGGEQASVHLRLTSTQETQSPDAPFADFDSIFGRRQAEADEFYAEVQPATLSEDERHVQRQAFAGMLWSKQFYYYDVTEWLRGDPAQPPPPEERRHGRNSQWEHFNGADVISMPDKWEYPWFAAWDLAFHCVPLARVDPDFAKSQLILLGREWYQHPNGQIPAYEWSFGDVNPPVLAWAAWRVYQIEAEMRGEGDRRFLERVFHKLLLNFTWWVNRKDAEGMNIFQGGFLGLDNIGVFDRSAPLPTGGHIEQSDGTSWMGMFCLNMLSIALELARRDHVYEDIATKFFEHFIYIAGAMNNIGGEGISLWDEEDEFFYDVLHVHQGDGDRHFPLKVRSMVGLIPLFAVCTIEPGLLSMLPDFQGRLEWFLNHRPDLAGLVSRWQVMGMHDRHLLALLRGHRMKRVLRRMLDPDEFLSPYGVRALSRYHAEHPYRFDSMGMPYTVRYLPAESDSGLFGGNSNWRGPVWFPVNFLIVEALEQFHTYYGDDFKVECPTGSGQLLTLHEIAGELSRRLTRIFIRDADGRRPVFGDQAKFQLDPHWRDYVWFYEYLNGDDGSGLGASHQTGWTGLVAELLLREGRERSAHQSLR